MQTSNPSAQTVVIGAGPGGYACAFLAADIGLHVTLIDPSPNPGGACVYRGCIPSKALLHAAKCINEAKEAETWGVSFGAPKIDIGKLGAWKDGVVRKLTDGLGQLVRHRKIVYMQGRARFLNAHSVEIQPIQGGVQTLSFAHAVVATGSQPAVPGPLNTESPRVWDSTDALALDVVPKTMLVVGGGYIGLELGCVYAALGTEITVVEMTPGLLPGMDADLVRFLHARLGSRFKSIRLNTTVESLKQDEDGVEAVLHEEGKPEEKQYFESVLIAVGRLPSHENLGLEKTRIRVGPKGFLEVDGWGRTAEPSIFAVGDVKGGLLLAHKASHEGRIVAEVLAGTQGARQAKAVPAVVYTDPEIATCGLSEREARETGLPVRAYRYPWAASGRALTLGRTDGMTKLIVDAGSREILGMGIVGPGAGELIAEGVLAMEAGITAESLGRCVHPHPTLSETVMEAAEMASGTCTHVFMANRTFS